MSHRLHSPWKGRSESDGLGAFMRRSGRAAHHTTNSLCYGKCNVASNDQLDESGSTLRHKDALVACLFAATGFDKAEPRIERDVFGHRRMRIQPQLAIAAAS